MMDAPTLDHSIEDAQRSDVLDELRGIRKAVSAKPEKPSEATFLINQDGATHVRMRIVNLLLSVDHTGAVKITLSVGSRTFVYNAVGPLTLVVPPPVTVVDRGIDVTATADNGDVTLAQFRYTVDE